MREKEKRVVFTFHTTQAAMAAESLFREEGLPGRLIPVPRQITAGCGLAWSAPFKEGPVLQKRLSEAGLSWQSACELFL